MTTKKKSLTCNLCEAEGSVRCLRSRKPKTSISLSPCRLYPLPDDLLQYPSLAHQYSLAGVVPQKPPTIAAVNWGEAVMSIVDGLMGRGEGTKVLAHIDPGGTATLLFELGGSKVCELYVCWKVLFFL